MPNSLQTIFDYNLIFFDYKISGLIDIIINHIILFILSQLFGETISYYTSQLSSVFFFKILFYFH